MIKIIYTNTRLIYWKCLKLIEQLNAPRMIFVLLFSLSTFGPLKKVAEKLLLKETWLETNLLWIVFWQKTGTEDLLYHSDIVRTGETNLYEDIQKYLRSENYINYQQ